MNIWYIASLSFLCLSYIRTTYTLNLYKLYTSLFHICIHNNILAYLWIREEFAEDHCDIRIVYIVYRIGSTIVSLVSSATSVRDSSKMCFELRDENTRDSKFFPFLSLLHYTLYKLSLFSINCNLIV